MRRPAHGDFDPGERAAVWERTAQAVRERGYELALADPARGILVTRELERQAPCGGTTCLARDILHLRIEDGRAVANLQRRVWDAALRTWAEPSDRRAIKGIEAEEREFLSSLGVREIVVRRSSAGEGCADDADCAGGLACSSRRCGAKPAAR